MNKSFESLVVGAGDFENLSFLEKDCRNYIDKARRLRLGIGGAGALRDYFLRMQYTNLELFALMDLDDDGRSLIEKRYQDLYTNAKFREVQHQLTSIINLDPVLLKVDATLKTYLVEDEVCVEDFTKLITHSVDFSEDDVVAKCSCGLFEMRGIVSRHIFVVFKCNRIKTIPDRYIIERWRKDIKRKYTLIHSGYDAGDQREDANRNSSLLNICYKMITCAAGPKMHTEDATIKLNAMIDLYYANQEPPSMTQKCLNIDATTKDTTTIGSSTKVLSQLLCEEKADPHF
ncbi:protein FAR-RED IMPAIRED RESPONSE 1-like [Juglans microcarpa x Juglans regia]|uniref:protein FAR-RED IMPAIRED RESPONSE 1-like n=1 Tax=Juglans microcarpa x Juglans regia TaxID=2249226 RepID=UPI001B7E362F|nr:protein FAR-RED IMPAIRED RESPONSE 1-like [Juglans microcarpa x Juglans regia]